MNKVDHLKIIEDVISRMAGNSFLTKGWCVTLVSAVIVLSAKEPNKKIAVIAFLPLIMFWVLDSYFLFQERLFRKLYNVVRLKDGDESDFSMDTSVENKEGSKITWNNAMFSKTLIVFYVTLVVILLIIILAL